MKTALITGTTSGMGRVCAIELAKLNYELILIARNIEKGKKLLNEIFFINPDSKVELYISDLSSVNEIKLLAEKIIHKYPKLDLMINNAGAYFSNKKLSADGIELTFATNHIPYYYLTKLLIPLLSSSQKARVVFVASEAQKFAKPNFKDLQFTKHYNAMQAYASSKLYNIMVAFYFAEKYKNTNITFNAMHPGGVNTGFAKDAKGITGFIFRVLKFMLRTPEKGAETILWLALSNEVENFNGLYFFDKSKIKPQQMAYNNEIINLLISETENIIANAL